jgi:DNA polymerase
MSILHIDYETRSKVPLNGKESVGLWNYARHDSTEPLMCAYAFGDEEPKLWVCHEGPMPSELREGLENPNQPLSAFNSAFERYITKFKVGIDTTVSRYEDPQIGSRYLSMPGDLDTVSDILGLPEHLAKDKRGDTLIKLFCEPQVQKKTKTRPERIYWADWTTSPVEWEQFKEYCKRDIVAERECARRMKLLGALPLPPFEQRLWEFDQRVNDTGIPVDRQFVMSAHKLAVKAKQEAKDRQNAITGLENANSTTQLLPWVQERGYPFSTLNKNTVESVLNDPEVKLTAECREVLMARKEAGSTSYTKLSAIMRQICADDRLRNMFVFLGSPRCGRWSGNSVQLQNLARPDKVFEEMENVLIARELIRGEKYDELKVRFGSVLLVVKNLIRTVFSCETI